MVAVVIFGLNQPRGAAAQADVTTPSSPEWQLGNERVTSQSAQAISVVGGEAADPEAWPWTVALIWADMEPYDGHFCGGSLIDAQWVLTAAHCVASGTGAIAPDALYIWANSHTLTGSDGNRIPVTQVLVHANFNTTTAENDIALLELAAPVAGPYVGLPTTDALRALATPSTVATVIGWGTTATVQRAEQRQQVNVPVVDNPTCAAAYGVWELFVGDDMLCAGYADGGYDACSGDSGGPLVVPNPQVTANGAPGWIEIGIVSWGRDCAKAGAYGVYTRTSSFIEWIEAQMGSPLPQNSNLTEAQSQESVPQGAESSHYTFLPVIQS